MLHQHFPMLHKKENRFQIFPLLRFQVELMCPLDLLKGIMCHINVIPVNNVEENSFEKPSAEKISRFCKYLESKGFTATVRRELGSDINASCGQLRKNNL